MSARPGRVAVLEQLAADGFTHMFGNPGTVEQGFLDAVPDSGIEYVLALQETVAVAMADGYARAGRRPALVQLHSGVGLGNGIGMLYQARRGGTPLVVLVGEAGVRYDAMDGQMAADLVGMAEPVTKAALRALSPCSVLRVLRRAIKVAQTPPTGPVVVILPADVLDRLTDEPVVPTSVPVTRVAPEPGLIADAARLLQAGRRPLILMGDGVAAAGAQPELTAIAEKLGAPVWGVNSSEVNFDTTHPWYGGQFGHMFGADSAAVVGTADAVLVVGTYLFPEVYPALASPFRPDARIVHVDADPDQIAKNFPVDIGVCADPKRTLAALAGRLTGTGRPAPVPAGEAPADDSVWARFVRTLAERLPDDVIVFDEALTAGGPVARYLPPTTPGRFFQTRGGSLGVGIPGAMGVKLARPDAPVVGFTGDGGSMYTVQALWTAARMGIDATFAICNNHRYRLLDANIERYWQDVGEPPHEHPAFFDLSGPDIDFAALAESLGVPGRRVVKHDDVDPVVDELVRHHGPFLIDVAVD